MDLTKLNKPLCELPANVVKALVKAHKNGELIEIYTESDLKWYPSSFPLWRDKNVYRVKPSDTPKETFKVPNKGFVEVTYLDGEMISLVWTKTAT